MVQAIIPQRIHRGETAVVITWSESHQGVFPNRALRLMCQCASCRDELTGLPLLDPADVPEDITVRSISLVGSYAIRIDWSDGHNTGIYSYDFLLTHCPCDACEQKRNHS